MLVGLGGWIGAVTRYYVGLWAAARWGVAFPYGTLLINLTGCLFLGWFGTLATERAALVSPDLRTLLAIGFVGAYTTFSTFGFETVRLLEEGDVLLALVYVLASVLVGLLAVYLGVVSARAMA